MAQQVQAKPAKLVVSLFALMDSAVNAASKTADLMADVTNGVVDYANNMDNNGFEVRQGFKEFLTSVVKIAENANMFLHNVGVNQVVDQFFSPFLPLESQIVTDYHTFATQKTGDEKADAAFAIFAAAHGLDTSDTNLEDLYKKTKKYIKSDKGWKVIYDLFQNAPVNCFFSFSLKTIFTYAPKEFAETETNSELFKLINDTLTANELGISDYKQEILHDGICRIVGYVGAAVCITDALAKQTIPSVKLSRTSDVGLKNFTKVAREEAKSFPATIYPTGTDATFETVLRLVLDQFFRSRRAF